MASLALKEYQRESLSAIGQFCESVRVAVARQAMRPVHDAYYADTGRDFIEVPQLPNVPYVAIRKGGMGDDHRAPWQRHVWSQAWR